MIIQNPTSLSMLKQALEQSTLISVDLETNVTDNPKNRFVVGIAVATEDQTFYIPVGHHCQISSLNLTYDGVLPANLFSNVQGIVCHNAKFDIPLLRKMGFVIRDEQVECTLMQSYLIDENPPHGLDALGLKYFNIGKTGTDFIKEMAKVAGGYERVPAEGMAKYAEQDALLARNLFYALQPAFAEFRELWEKIERPFLFLLAKMEDEGLLIDVQEAGNKSAQTYLRMEQIRQELGFDPAKTKELHLKLFSDPPIGLGLKARISTKGNPVADVNFLKSIGHPITALVLEYRQCAKIKSAYYDPYVRLAGASRRIHPTFKPWGTVTGRLSCENPNFQQIPREQTNSIVKKLFLAEPDCELWEFDFKAIEYRLTTIYSQDESLIDIFKREEDFHQAVADELHISRHAAKTLNFATIYGAGPRKLAAQLGLPFSSADMISNQYRNRYPAIFAVAQKAQATAESNKGKVRMWDGRYRRFKYPGEYHKAFNAVIQGGAFSIVKQSMLNLDAAGYKIVNQVHDSVWLQLPKPVTETVLADIHHHLSDWTIPEFGLRFSCDAKRLA